MPPGGAAGRTLPLEAVLAQDAHHGEVARHLAQVEDGRVVQLDDRRRLRVERTVLALLLVAATARGHHRHGRVGRNSVQRERKWNLLVWHITYIDRARVKHVVLVICL